MFRRAFGESAGEVVERERRGEVEEAVRARARSTGAVPSEKELEEHNLDYAAFRTWRPHCVKGRAESYGHAEKAQNEGEAPTVGVGYTHMHTRTARRR
jgi:hypothetical protein